MDLAVDRSTSVPLCVPNCGRSVTLAKNQSVLAHLPVAAGAVKHAIGLHVEIARTRTGRSSSCSRFAVLDEIAEWTAIFVEKSPAFIAKATVSPSCASSPPSGCDNAYRRARSAVSRCCAWRDQRGNASSAISSKVTSLQTVSPGGNIFAPAVRACRFGARPLRRSAHGQPVHPPVAARRPSAQAASRQAAQTHLHWPNPGSLARRTASFAAASRAPAFASHSLCS